MNMEEDKLLEAARMIQEHCYTKQNGERCCFSEIGVCNGVFECTIGGKRMFPMEWEIPDNGDEQ